MATPPLHEPPRRRAPRLSAAARRHHRHWGGALRRPSLRGATRGSYLPISDLLARDQEIQEHEVPGGRASGRSRGREGRRRHLDLEFRASYPNNVSALLPLPSLLNTPLGAQLTESTAAVAGEPSEPCAWVKQVHDEVAAPPPPPPAVASDPTPVLGGRGGPVGSAEKDLAGGTRVL
ncbi:unnamed protein product [Urochloa humidicola]